MTDKPSSLHLYHRFLDEAGDTTFYAKGRAPIVGQNGVSLAFMLGMVKFRTELEPIRQNIIALQKQVEDEAYFRNILSVQNKKSKGGFYFHATDDVPEVRKIFYDYIRTLDISFEACVARKVPDIFALKHHNKESEFYADILSHLLKNKFELGGRLVLNIAERGKTTKNETLTLALDKAKYRYNNKKPDNGGILTKISFNVQNQQREPLLNIADYLCWAVQRVFERGEVRYYEYMLDKISLVVDVYDTEKYEGSKNYYTSKHPLTSENKLSPPIH